MTILFFFLLQCVHAAKISLTIQFTETSLNEKWFYASDRVFGVNWYTCLETRGNISIGGTTECPSGEASFDSSLFVTPADKTATSTWVKVINIPERYTGLVTIQLFAPMALEFEGTLIKFNSSVTSCLSLADNEMGGEICGNHGQPWSITITDSAQTLSLTTFPSFGIGSTGTTLVLLPSLFSPQLNNTRDVAAYLPPSLLQNKMSRKMNVMIVLDGALSTIETYSKRTGFEAHQMMGVIPESIMIGITTVEFAYAGDFNQRTYELTYAVAESYPTQTCISGENGPTGGADLLLQFIRDTVIPKALEELGMTLGEISIHGGSLGGLTACYAASKYPETFSRAICASPSNCFNFGSGGLASVIASNYVQNNLAPKSVIQFLGSEALTGDGRIDGDEYQMDYLLRDDAAWQSIGLKPVTMASLYTTETKSGASGYNRLMPLPDHIIMTMLLPGGQHAPSTWEQVFATSLPILYRANRSDKLRIPKSESLAYYSLPPPEDTIVDDSGDDDDEDFHLSLGGVIACVVVPTVVTALTMILYFQFVLKPALLSSKKNVFDETASRSPLQIE